MKAAVTMNAYYVNQTVNMNDNIILNISASGVNPDDVIYYAGLVYNGYIVGALPLFFNQAKIKLWNGFSNVTSSDSVGV